MDNCSIAGGGQTMDNVDNISMAPDMGMVAVIDHLSVTPETCEADALVAAVSYWCQGKPGGCNIEKELWKSVIQDCPDNNLNVSIRWHYEEDYNSREIPCPSYGHGALEKKFSKFKKVQ